MPPPQCQAATSSSALPLLHGRALEDNLWVPLIMDSMQGAELAQALVPRGHSTAAQHIAEQLNTS